MIWKNWINFLGVLCVIAGISSCYSFKGASLDPNLKTLQVSNIRMETAGGPANLSLEINEIDFITRSDFEAVEETNDNTNKSKGYTGGRSFS